MAPVMGGRRGGLRPLVALPLAVAAVLVFASAAAALSWRESADAFWAHGCDFPSDRDSGRSSTRGEDCSGACGRSAGCTHFVWSFGTCYFKTGPRGRGDATVTAVPGAVCGLMKSPASGGTVVPLPAPVFPSRYLPIFRFDDGAGSSCFPDDKRQAATRDGTCRGWDPHAPVFYATARCGDMVVYQYGLWYGKQRSCFLGFGAHGDDNEYVQVWVSASSGAVVKVRFNQHNGYYFKARGSSLQLVASTRPVVYIGKNSHGAYHFGCDGKFWTGGAKCVGGCTYWDDFRNSAKQRYILTSGRLVRDPSPREIACDVAECTPGHSNKRAVIKNGACYGPTV